MFGFELEGTDWAALAQEWIRQRLAVDALAQEAQEQENQAPPPLPQETLPPLPDQPPPPLPGNHPDITNPPSQARQGTV